MASIERFRQWLARLWAGEVALITDEGWLPSPLDTATLDAGIPPR